MEDVSSGFAGFQMRGESSTLNLIVALWSLNTKSMQHLTLDARWDVLKAAVKEAYDLAKDRVPTRGTGGAKIYSPFALFVAPEYLMAQPTPHMVGDQLPPQLPVNWLDPGYAGDRRHIDETQKDIQLNRYISLSHACEGMILVPGTIAWRKPLVRPVAKPVSRYDKAIQDVQTHALNQPGWNTWPGGALNRPLSGQLNRAFGGPVTAPTTQQKLSALTESRAWGQGPLLSHPLQYMARNTAYVLLNGKVLCKYHKQGDFHEVLTGQDTVHIPGRLSGRFPVYPTSKNQRPIRFGIEICLDHAGGGLWKDISDKGYVDVHIITSAQLPTDQAKTATDRAGFVVHASSNSDNTGVFSRFEVGTQSGLSRAVSLKKLEVLGHPLHLWQIDLDLALAPQQTETSSSFFGNFLGGVFK